MIGRFWRGRASAENGARYEELLRAEILPGIHRIEGYRGASLPRRDVEGAVEFATLTLWESLERSPRVRGRGLRGGGRPA